MSTKTIGSGLATLIICSDLDVDSTLAWAKENCPTPGKKLHWNPYTNNKCNCKSDKQTNTKKHYLFSIFT